MLFYFMYNINKIVSYHALSSIYKIKPINILFTLLLLKTNGWTLYYRIVNKKLK
jgi:uncharacterized membrane protein